MRRTGGISTRYHASRHCNGQGTRTIGLTFILWGSSRLWQDANRLVGACWSVYGADYRQLFAGACSAVDDCAEAVERINVLLYLQNEKELKKKKSFVVAVCFPCGQDEARVGARGAGLSRCLPEQCTDRTKSVNISPLLSRIVTSKGPIPVVSWLFSFLFKSKNGMP